MFENEAKEKAKRKIYNFIVSNWGVSQIRTEKNWETVEGVPYFYQNSLEKMWQEGAEFGYNKCKEELNQQGLALQSDMDKTIEQNIALKKELNKANEWHYVKDGKDLPLEAGLHIRVVLHNGNEYICETDYYEPSEDEIGFGHLLIQLYSNDEWIDDNDVYAWCELSMPPKKE